MIGIYSGNYKYFFSHKNIKPHIYLQFIPILIVIITYFLTQNIKLNIYLQSIPVLIIKNICFYFFTYKNYNIKAQSQVSIFAF